MGPIRLAVSWPSAEAIGYVPSGVAEVFTVAESARRVLQEMKPKLTLERMLGGK